MKVRKIKRRYCSGKKSKFQRKVFRMRFIKVGNSLYPYSDRIVFSIKDNGSISSDLYLSYTDSQTLQVRISDVTNMKMNKHALEVIVKKVVDPLVVTL